jgi:hypothetical protein
LVCENWCVRVGVWQLVWLRALSGWFGKMEEEWMYEEDME